MSPLKISLLALAVSAAASCHQNYDLSEHIGICRIKDDALICQSGYNYLEVSIANCLVPNRSDSLWSEKYEMLKGLSLPTQAANGFFPGSYRLVGPDADLQRNLKYTETAMQRASQAGIEVFVLGSGDARRIPDGFSREEARAQFVQLCKGIGELGEKYGIVTVIEPLCSKETNFINSVREGLEIVKAVDKPYLQVLADFYHMAQEGEGPDALIEAGEHLRHCHIAEKVNRTAPGTEGDDFTPYFKALKKIGYKGRISMECTFVELETDLQSAITETKRQIHSVF